MKAIKLSLIFGLILACIVGALYWSDIDPDDNIVITDNTIPELSKEINDGWKDAGHWDESLYKKYDNKLRQYEKHCDVATLFETNTRLAIETVDKTLTEEWQKAGCSKDVIDTHISALDTICRIDNRAGKDSRVKQLRAINNVYQQAYKVAHMSIGLKVLFNGATWNNFNNYAKGVRYKRDAILDDATYKSHLANISDIKNGLAGIDKRLGDARDSFYKQLASDIIARYKNADRTRENLINLRDMRRTYQIEYNKESEPLNKFIERFYNDVQRESRIQTEGR